MIQFVTTIIWWMFTKKLIADSLITEILLYTEHTTVSKYTLVLFKEISMKIYIYYLFLNNHLVNGIDTTCISN